MKNYLGEYVDIVRNVVRQQIKEFFPELLDDDALIERARKNTLWRDPMMIQIAMSRLERKERR